MATATTIQKNDFESTTAEILSLANEVMEETKAQDVALYDVRSTGIAVLFDALMVCTVTSSRHGAALADRLRLRLKRGGHSPLSHEGPGESGWSVVCAGRAACHIMSAHAREHYDLDGLWGMEMNS